ncbi:calcium and integrin-binding protein 1-like [Apis laboriosa]|uniref:calcium and integrin-binding protein 1-like n=1 Tax=Apis laboriosa TaxID=183418 RepID=UPI001CC4CD5C|nr:calcium and integrin-binding protein 1-like [Apis laboriosa]
MSNFWTRFKNFFSTDHILDEETIATYVELTYLKKNEIQHVINLLDNVNPGKLRQNPHHRFTIEEIETILPQLQCSPFRDSIYRVFSSKKDKRLSLEDVLDLCSAFSEYCPDNVRATWAFYVFDLNGDGEISSNDLIETVQRLMWPQNEYGGIDTAEAEHVARIILQEMVFNRQGSISCEEFIRFSSRISEFWSSFRFKI